MNKRKEKISAFLDNAIHQDELMSFSLSAEAEDAKTAQRYQIIGDTLRGELHNASFIDVSHAVSESLAGENIADEMPAMRNHSPDAVKVQSGRVASSWDVSSWFKPVAGLSFAVMVAVVMVLTMSGQDAGVIAPVASNTPPVPMAQPTAVADTGQKSSASDTTPIVAADKKSKDIDPYINQHLEYATQDVLQGRLPYVRAVNYEAGK